MKKIICIGMVAALGLSGVAFAADATTTAAAPGFMDWLAQNKAVVIGAALAISELLALIPGIKGNGILDMVINLLKSEQGKAAK